MLSPSPKTPASASTASKVINSAMETGVHSAISELRELLLSVRTENACNFAKLEHMLTELRASPPARAQPALVSPSNAMPSGGPTTDAVSARTAIPTCRALRDRHLCASSTVVADAGRTPDSVLPPMGQATPTSSPWRLGQGKRGQYGHPPSSSSLSQTWCRRLRGIPQAGSQLVAASELASSTADEPANIRLIREDTGLIGNRAAPDTARRESGASSLRETNSTTSTKQEEHEVPVTLPRLLGSVRHSAGDLCADNPQQVPILDVDTLPGHMQRNDRCSDQPHTSDDNCDSDDTPPSACKLSELIERTPTMENFAVEMLKKGSAAKRATKPRGHLPTSQSISKQIQEIKQRQSQPVQARLIGKVESLPTHLESVDGKRKRMGKTHNGKLHCDDVTAQHCPSSPRERPLSDRERPSFEHGRPSLDRERPSFERDRPSFERGRPSFDRERPSFERDRPSFERSRRSFERHSHNSFTACSGTSSRDDNEGRGTSRSVNELRRQLEKELTIMAECTSPSPSDDDMMDFASDTSEWISQRWQRTFQVALRASGMVPWRVQLAGTACVASRCYQCTMVLVMVFTTMYPALHAAMGTSHLMVTIPFALGGLMGLLSVQNKLVREILWCFPGPLEMYAKRRGFTESWSNLSRKRIALALVLWVCAILVRSASVVHSWSEAMCVPSDADHGLSLASFIIGSLMFQMLVICQLHLISMLEIMVDRFCIQIYQEPDVAWGLDEWNVIQAILRLVATALDSCFLETQAMAQLALAIGAVHSMLNHSDDSCIFNHALSLLTVVLLSLGAWTHLYCAAAVTEKCSRVPALLNAMAMQHEERQCLVQYVTNSAAGFYVKEVRLTAGIALKLTYATCVCAVAVFTKIASEPVV